MEKIRGEAVNMLKGLTIVVDIYVNGSQRGFKLYGSCILEKEERMSLLLFNLRFLPQ